MVLGGRDRGIVFVFFNADLRPQRPYGLLLIIMYIYHTLINALSAHMIYINLVEHTKDDSSVNCLPLQFSLLLNCGTSGRQKRAKEKNQSYILTYSRIFKEKTFEISGSLARGTVPN